MLGVNYKSVACDVFLILGNVLWNLFEIIHLILVTTVKNTIFIPRRLRPHLQFPLLLR